MVLRLDDCGEQLLATSANVSDTAPRGGRSHLQDGECRCPPRLRSHDGGRGVLLGLRLLRRPRYRLRHAGRELCGSEAGRVLGMPHSSAGRRRPHLRDGGYGEHHTCGLTTDGATYCWGANAGGQLGTGTTTGPELCSVQSYTSSCSQVPVPVTGGLRFTEISVGYGFACGVVQTGAAYCWGGNVSGQLGSGSTTGPQLCDSMPCSASPVPVTGGLPFRMISAGWDVTCGATTGGAAYCWGWRNPGASAVPLPVSGGSLSRPSVQSNCTRAA